MLAALVPQLVHVGLAFALASPQPTTSPVPTPWFSPVCQQQLQPDGAAA